MKHVEAPPSSARGLTPEEVEASRRQNGENRLEAAKHKSFLRRFVSNLNDPVIRILLLALCVHLLMLFQNGDWIETVGIAVAVLLATLISTLSEHSSERAFARLSEGSAGVCCRVRRAGVVHALPIESLVVGDVVLLSAGEGVPADGVLLSGEGKVDQAAITGESRPVSKCAGVRFSKDSSAAPSPAHPSVLLRGSTLTAGECEMRVSAVGSASFFGQISHEVQIERRDSPLKLRLGKLARQISVFGYVCAVLVALAYLFNVFVLDSGWMREVILFRLSDPHFLFSHLLHALTLALTVVVVAVPEGLPMMIAVVLSSNTRRMLRDNVLVRKPVGIEAAGSMNLLFTDKTGTLTEGKMRLSAVAFGSGEETSLGEVLAEEGNVARWMRLAFRLGTAASEGLDAAGRRCALGGSPTERALLESVLSKPLPRGYRKTGTLAFSSERKYSAISLEGEERMTLVMGAPERLLPFVTRALCANGQPCAYRPSAVEASIRAHTSRGERVLLLTRSEEGIPASSLATGIRGSLLLVGILVLSDPLRREARTSVRRLQGAGVQVVMITGDGKETATYLASQCGILSGEHSLVLSGDELARLSDLQLSERLPSLAVVCRALPSDKSRLVRIAEERGLVTGMTGDGINDAPALRRADVGFSMGSGTQVAKDAGDVIVLDDNLASIVRAVLYGRTVFKSIRKFITLQLLMNFSAMAVTMLCPFFGVDSPVTVVQMLWINLIMDTLGGLAFAGEPPLEAYMREAPKRREEPILNRYMLHTILCHGAFTVGLCLYFLNSPRVAACFRPSDGGIVLLTAFFALFIFSSVFNCFGARTDRLRLLAGIRKNPVFLGIMVAVLAIQILFVYLGGSVLRTVPLTASELLVTGALSLAVIPAELCRKILWRLTKGKGGY